LREEVRITNGAAARWRENVERKKVKKKKKEKEEDEVFRDLSHAE
jgi:hypothetical protein